jgi:hypothetical protein
LNELNIAFFKILKQSVNKDDKRGEKVARDLEDWKEEDNLLESFWLSLSYNLSM